jgi:stalled ribosome alternative rescue factor ArfA
MSGTSGPNEGDLVVAKMLFRHWTAKAPQGQASAQRKSREGGHLIITKHRQDAFYAIGLCGRRVNLDKSWRKPGQLPDGFA